MEKFFADLEAGVIAGAVRGVIAAEAANLVKAHALDADKEAVTISGMTDGIMAMLKLYNVTKAS